MRDVSSFLLRTRVLISLVNEKYARFSLVLVGAWGLLGGCREGFLRHRGMRDARFEVRSLVKMRFVPGDFVDTRGGRSPNGSHFDQGSHTKGEYG